MDVDAADRAELEQRGFVVLRNTVDAAALSGEFDAVMADAFADAAHANAGSAGNRFRYVPMMSEHTPISLRTTTQLASVASALLGGPVLPGRTKATRYLTGTGWHRDSEVALRTVGMLCYLDPLDGDAGALRVVPGSHLDASAAPVALDAGVAVDTSPGDVIVFDEHLLHASTGGGTTRRQWRVDFVATGESAGDPAGGTAGADGDIVGDAGADEVLRRYYAALHAPGWDGGYDVGRYPSYGAAWRRLDPRWDRRLGELGAYAAAAAEESAASAARAARPR
jgi:hypothetical protein